jgi:23S rRNA (adenine1618-N6)-methyltransferase
VVRHQPSQGSVLKGVLKDGETIDFAMCNPPFFASPQEFLAANSRKVRNLAQNAAKRGGAKGQRARPAARASVVAAAGSARRPSSNNFEGDASELWCQGGECAFIEAMAKESQLLKDRCLWFSSLVSRADNLPTLLRTLDALPDLKQR